jgi:hypothetical protein
LIAPNLIDSGSLSDLRTPSLIAVMSASVSLNGFCALREEEAAAAAAAVGLGATAVGVGTTTVGVGATAAGVAATLPVVEDSLVTEPAKVAAVITTSTIRMMRLSGIH